MNNELMNPLAGPLTTAARQSFASIRPDDEQDPRTRGNAIKPAARNPATSMPGLSTPAGGTVPSGGDGTNPLTKIVAALPPMRDQHGNDMTATNKMKAQLGEAPVGTAPAATPAAPVIAPQAAPSPVARDQYGNDMTRTNAMKAQLGEAPIGAPAQNPLPAANPLVEPTSPNAVTTPQAKQSGAVNPAEGQKQTSFSETGSNPLTMFGPVDAHGNSLAATNEMQAKLNELTSTAPANVTTLENSGLKQSQELMDKWGRQDMQREMLQEIARNPRAANAIAGLAANANNTESEMRRQDLAAEEAMRRDSTVQRGQDLVAQTEQRGQDVTAQTASAKLAGNPLTNALTQAQVETERLSADKTRRQNDVLSQLDRETDPAKRETLIENALVAQGKAPQQGERLTLAQMRANREIHAARQKIAGLSPEEIRRKTAKQTNTGRENPDFDPALERAVSLAGRRKIGSDDEFDQRQVQAPTAQPAGDVSTRFTADPAMKNHRLGQQTDLGTEVFDAAGKLIGHYR